MESKDTVEFQAVILAGGMGNRMFPLTTEIPKPLLPMVNRPLLSYQLDLLASAGFAEVIVLTVEKIAAQVSKYVTELHSGKIRVQLIVLEEYMGTADALRKIKDHLKTDFLVISGDLVTDVFIHYLADIHRSKDAGLTVLLKETPPPKEDAKAPKKKEVDEDMSQQYVGLDDKTGRIVYFKSAADVEEDLKVPRSLLKRCPNFTIYTKLLDCHLYIFSHWVLDVLEEKKMISSIQGELVPYLVRLQFAKPKDGAKGAHPSMAVRMSHTPQSLRADAGGCFAYVAKESSYASRSNTVATYIRMNKEIADMPVSERTPWSPITDRNDQDNAIKNNPKSQIGSSVIGVGLKAGEKSSIKKSIIGKHCKIGEGVRISNSIIMDYVTIEDGSIVEHSVICRDTSIGAGSKLTDGTIVGAAYKVPKKSVLKNEVVSGGGANSVVL